MTEADFRFHHPIFAAAIEIKSDLKLTKEEYKSMIWSNSNLQWDIAKSMMHYSPILVIIGAAVVLKLVTDHLLN